MYNLINEIENRAFTNLTDREANVIREIKNQNQMMLDYFETHENASTSDMKELYWKWSCEADTKSKAMLVCFNMIQEHIELALSDCIFGELVEIEDDCMSLEEQKREQLEICIEMLQDLL